MGTSGLLILVASILAVTVMLGLALLAWLRGRLRRSAAELRALVRGDERLVLEPAAGNYRGATDRFGKVKGSAVLALTDRRLLCAKALGARIEVPLADVVDVREDTWFLRSYNSLPHLILKLRDGVEVGFQVRDHARWIETLRARIGQSPQADSSRR